MVISHLSPEYQAMCGGQQNGAFWYSHEICENIIPRIYTDRNWVTIRCGKATDHAIVFIHNNLKPQLYDYLQRYEDLILVCGVPETCEKVAHLGTPIYLPLSVDVDYVSRFKRDYHPLDTAFAGRPAKMRYGVLPPDIDIIGGISRPRLLRRMAMYTDIYAVGRTAIEAKVLGCNVLPYDKRFPDPDFWQVLDNKDAAKILQKKLDEIDGGKHVQ